MCILELNFNIALQLHKLWQQSGSISLMHQEVKQRIMNDAKIKRTLENLGWKMMVSHASIMPE